MPRGIKGSGPTRTRTATTRRRQTATVIVQVPGQLIWRGVPIGGTAFEVYEMPTGGVQMFQLSNIDGTITSTLMFAQAAGGRTPIAGSSTIGSAITRRTRRAETPHANGASNGSGTVRRTRRVSTTRRASPILAEA